MGLRVLTEQKDATLRQNKKCEKHQYSEKASKVRWRPSKSDYKGTNFDEIPELLRLQKYQIRDMVRERHKNSPGYR